MARRGLALLIGVFAVHSAYAEDAGLNALAAKLVVVRSTHAALSQYDAGPELTPIKHALRQWVEAQLPSLLKEGAPARFAEGLNARLGSKGLTCGDEPNERCKEPMSAGDTQMNARGYLSKISLSYLEYSHYLLLRTGVGVRCGFDESAYVYERRSDGWRLILETEQDRYDDKQYSPQNFLAIKTSPAGIAWNATPSKPPLVLTLGYSPWCQSNWQMLYTRLWRASPTNVTPKPIIDAADGVFLTDMIADGEVSDDDVFVRFDARSIDSGGVRTHLHHFLVHGDVVERIAPVALNPKDFVDEWLTRPWTESARWIDKASEPSALQKWYGAFPRGKEIIFGEFDKGPFHCRSDSTLWQVGFTQDAGPKNPEISAYFLVRWMAPYRFSLVAIRNAKFSGCDIKDSMPDNPGTSFPLR